MKTTVSTKAVERLRTKRRGRLETVMHQAETIWFKEVTTGDDLREAQRIRALVLEAEQGFAHDVNIDGHDDSAYHVLMLDGDRAVGTARLTETGPGEGMIARIAVLPSHRGSGLGEGLVRELESVAALRGLEAVHVEPHAHLGGFFERLGYERLAEAFTQDQHHLIRMRKAL